MTDIDETEHRYFDDTEPGDVETPDDTPPPPIGNLTEANWHLRKIANAIRRRNELAAVYDAEMERLRLRWMTRLERIEASIAWHTAPLESYALMRRETDGTKTLELPHGVIRTSKGSAPKVTVTDEAATIAWAGESLPDMVEHKPRLVKAVLNAYVQASGEIPPGVTVTPPAVTVTITPTEGGTE